MTALKTRVAVSATALLAGLAGQAQAQVTAQEVWDDWRSSLELYGEDGVTIGSEEAAGGVLTVTDIALSGAAEDGTTFAATLPEMVLTENGDGTVTVTMSEEYPITISSPGDPAMGTNPSEVVLALRQSGLTMTVSGTPGALTYDLAAARYALELDSVTEAGAEVPAEAMLAFNDVSGTYTAATGEARDVAYDLAAASLDLLVDVTNPEDGSRLTVSGQIDDVASDGAMTLPLGMDMMAPDAILQEGLAVAGGYTYGAADYIFEVADAAGATNGTVSTASGSLRFSLDSGAVGYDSSITGVAVQATSAQLPLPIDVSIAEYGISLLMPLAASDAPTDWALGVNLTDLAVNDEIWGLLDPSGMLPRDPVTAIVDLTGTATLLFDLADPAQMEAMEAAPMPGEINSVTLNDLNLSVAGAQLTGTGSFTFDNADLTTYPGIPRPEGAAEFQISGLNGLIDTLVSMGLIPQEQVMGARMMLGLLAVPVGEDQLESRIEVNAEGHLLANGQRLQ